MYDPNEGIEPMDAAQFYGEREPVMGPTWFRIVVEARGTEAIGHVLVIGGRIASHSFGFCFVGKDFEEYRADAERKSWKLEELPCLP